MKALGSRIRPQSDIREIDKDLKPLWFAGISPSKINLGFAYYGRGYTLSDPSCGFIDCLFKGPSKPAKCTNSDGDMSNLEIRRLVKEKHLTPNFVKEAMVKTLNWDDQWLGYDDEETIKLKTEFANSRCLGGTMIWAIDYDSGDEELVGTSHGVQKGADATFPPEFKVPLQQCNPIVFPWACQHCSDPDLSLATDLDADKWIRTNAESLWNAAKTWWTTTARDLMPRYKVQRTFSDAVAIYVAAKQAFDCSPKADNGQCVYKPCEDEQNMAPAARYLLTPSPILKMYVFHPLVYHY